MITIKQRFITYIIYLIIILEFVFIVTSNNFDINVLGETYPDKDISTDTVWTKDQGPYMINQNVMVASNAKLTIEAGTEILFLNSSILGIKGILNVAGKENDPVVFRYHSSIGDEIEPHRCINIKNEEDDSVEIKYAKFYDFHGAIYIESPSGHVLIHRSEFRNHYTAVNSRGSSDTVIEKCVFENNTYSVHGSDIEIRDSIFKNNEYGLYEVERTNVYDSVFNRNNISIYGNDGEIKRCKISENDIGIQTYGDGFSIYSNHIVNNNIGILFTSEETIIHYNNIYNNSVYNLKSLSHDDIDATNNWWGTIETELIDQSIFAYEIYDNQIMGEIIYEPFLQSEIIDFSDKDDDGIPDDLDEDISNGKKSSPNFEIIYLIFILTLLIIVIIVLLTKRKKWK